MAGILAGWFGIQAAFLVFVPFYALLGGALLFRAQVRRGEDLVTRSTSRALAE